MQTLRLPTTPLTSESAKQQEQHQQQLMQQQAANLVLASSLMNASASSPLVQVRVVAVSFY